MMWLLILLVIISGLVAIPTLRFLAGFIAGAIWQWREIRKRRP